MTVALCALAIVAVVAWLVYSKLARNGSVTEDAALAAVAASDGETPLLHEMMGLRRDLRRERRKHLRDRAVFILVTLAFLLLWNGQRNAVDRIEATRSQSRIGLCHAIDDMRAKHNHLVNTAIAERQTIIDKTDASPTATDAQKASTHQLFDVEIANYQQDLNEIIDCSNPEQVASLFKTPGG